jgi:hypothetical protein
LIVEIAEPAATIVHGLSGSQLVTVQQNIRTIESDPQAAGRPTSSSRVKARAWQHHCSVDRSRTVFVIFYRWVGGDPRQPGDTVTIEDIVQSFH